MQHRSGVRRERPARSYYRLIKPIPDYYSAFNTGIHGIMAANTRRAPRFPDIWQEVLPKIVIYRARYKMATSKRPAKTPSRAAAAIRLMKDLGYGEGYQLAHYHADKLTTMQTMPDNLIGRKYDFPTEEDHEQRFKARWNKSSAGKQNIRAGQPLSRWAPLLGPPSGIC